MNGQEYYTYIVTGEIRDYGFKLKPGDYMTTKQLLSLPPYYQCKVKLLNSPIKMPLS